MMKILLDTSVMVASSLESHPYHEWCLDWVKRAHKSEIHAVISAHSLAELYSVLTRMPLIPRITPTQAWDIIRVNFCDKIQVISLNQEDYCKLLSELTKNGVLGGRTYDGVIAYTGYLVGAQAVVTLNSSHFATFSFWGLQIIYPGLEQSS